MPKFNGRLPKYRLHGPSGRAVVTLNHTDHYLGIHGTDESRAAYDRLIAQWLANHRQPVPTAVQNAADGPQVEAVVLAFFQHAKAYYRRPDGSQTAEVDNYRQALRPLRRLYGKTPATGFGPLALDALRQHLVTLGWNRKYINRQVHRVCAIFKWAASRELLPVEVYQRLKTLAPLRRGRTQAPESEPVRPVPQPLIDGIEPFVSAAVWTMVQLQLLSGARPEDIVFLRPRNLHIQSTEVWTGQPEQHKTAWLEHKRVFYFGPRAIALLQPYVNGRNPDQHLFSPAEAERLRLTGRHARRRTPLSCGNVPGSNVRSQRARPPRDSYTVASYRRAIQRACDLAFPAPPHLARLRIEGIKGRRWETSNEWQARLGEKLWAELRTWQNEHRWHPHQLRHNAGTNLRRDFGIEIAQMVLGHRLGSGITEVYAETNTQRVLEIIRKVG